MSRACLPLKRLKPIFAVPVEFSPECGDTGSFPLSVGEYDLLKAETFQKLALDNERSLDSSDCQGLVGLLPFNLIEDNRMEKIAPE